MGFGAPGLGTCWLCKAFTRSSARVVSSMQLTHYMGSSPKEGPFSSPQHCVLSPRKRGPPPENGPKFRTHYMGVAL